MTFPCFRRSRTDLPIRVQGRRGAGQKGSLMSSSVQGRPRPTSRRTTKQSVGGRQDEPTNAPRRQAWEGHDMNKVSARVQLRNLARTLSDTADITAMRAYVRRRAGEIWGRPEKWPGMVEETLQTLDDREKALAEGRTAARGKPEGRMVSEAMIDQPRRESARTVWNIEDVRSADGLARLRQAADRLSDTAELAAMRAAVRVKAREVYGLSTRWPESVVELLAAITDRRVAVTAEQSPSPTFSRNKRDDPSRDLSSPAIQPRSTTDPTTWRDDVKTLDGITRLRV